MKRLLGLVFIGVALITAPLFAQDDRDPPPTGPGTPERDSPGRPSVPRAVKNNEQFRLWSENFQTARDSFRTELQAMRVSLSNASDDDKAAIQNQIRDLLRSHREKQNEFRKRVRRLMLDLRKAKVAPGTGQGG